MKLLFDHNLSPRLVMLLGEELAGSTHVYSLGMDRDSDISIWDYAKERGYTIITKDKDFLQRSLLLGHPPKIIHLRIGNCSVKDAEKLILRYVDHMREFQSNTSKSYLLLPVG